MKLFTYTAVSRSSKPLYALTSLFLFSFFAITLHAQKVDFSQAANNVKNGDGLGRVDWINGDLNGQNSVYAEGLSVPQRIILNDLTGTSHSLIFKYKVSETPGYGYDFITSWNQAIADAAGKLVGLDLSSSVANGADRFRDIDKNTGVTLSQYTSLHEGLANHRSVAIPVYTLLGNATQNLVDALNARVANYGQALSLDVFAEGGFTTDPTLTFNGFEGQGGGGKLAVMTLSWESAAALVSIEFAGHLALSDNGVTPANGASSMHGSSYHIKLGALDGNNFSSGRDNQIRVVQATTSCTPPDIDPQTFTLCDAGAGTASFSLSLAGVLGVPTGATIQWFSDIDLNNEITTTTYSASNGTVIYALVTDATDCYTVVPVTLVINPLPTICSVTTNPSCAQSTTGTGSITLAGSFTGISYQLTFANGDAVGGPISGTGSSCTSGSITWPGLASGDYKIVATNTSTQCSITSSTITVGSAQCVTTYTKGFWGNTGKEKCATNPRPAIDILRSMYSAPINFGAGSYKFSIVPGTDFYSQTDATCKPAQTYIPIQKMLPGGSTPDVLRNATTVSWGNRSTWSFSVGKTTYTLLGTDCKGNTYSSIMNNLLAQAIALRFNLSYDQNLAGVHLTGSCLKFNNLDCSGIIGSASSIQSIPGSVLTALGTNNTINDLYNLANQVLGQAVTSPSPADMTAALNAINVGFDGGKALTSQDNSCSNPTITQRDRQLFQTESELTVSAYPNPYSNRVNFTITSPIAGKASLQVYNALGQNVRIVFSGYLQAGQKQTVSFDVPAVMQSILFYKLQVGDRQVNGKVLQAKTE